MKRKMIFLFILLSFLLVSCRDPMEGRMETDESSIFGMGEIEYCRITSEEADVKAGVGNDFETIRTLNRDDVVRVLSQVGDWYVVQLDNNQIGGVDTSQAQPIVREEADPDPQPVEPDRQPQIAEEVPDPQAGDQPPAPEAQDGQQPTPAPQAQEPVEPDEVAPQPQTPRAAEIDGVIEGLTSLEEQMVNLLNGERQRNNLPALEVDLELTRVARIKSQDMVDHNYFSHYSPTYGSPFEMLDSFGIKYLHAGENLAGNPSVEDAHTSLMNSSGHRKNILNPDFTHIGIGVKPSNRYGQIFTQMFISKPR